MVQEGELLWQPSPDFAARSNIRQFQNWVEKRFDRSFGDYADLWRWSVEHCEDFWSAIWDYFDVSSDTPYRSVLEGDGRFDVRWFAGSRVNYAEHLLRHEASAPDGIALHHSAETRDPDVLTWSALGQRVRALAQSMRDLDIGPGDRVVSYMPNVWETVAAMLASISIGAIWSAAAPEFGAKTILDRFLQIAPKAIFVADGYSFAGRVFDRSDEAREIIAGLPSLDVVICLDFMGLPKPAFGIATHDFAALLDRPVIQPDDFRYQRVEHDHPLWILFSSGTTGLPKAIVHSHVGMIVEHLKIISLHCDLGPGKTMFFYSTTGWMMWNIVVASLISGGAAVLYDGSPTHGGADRLWRMAAETRTTCFGASPTLVQIMEKEKIRPIEAYDFSALETVLVGGAPSTPATFAWFYQNVKKDLWVTSQSGGTEFCSGLAVGVPTLPVRAGEIQARALGVDLDIWGEGGNSLIDEVGELVVLRPMPSMPLHLWGDDDGVRYRESYFSTFPGVWRHGDYATITGEGGLYIYGRSDATLNRYGVRIGTAEIYNVLDKIAGVEDSLIVCCELPDGGFYMPLFIQLSERHAPEAAIETVIARVLRDEASPRHVPDELHVVPQIPYTLTGKKMEVPVRKLLMGADVSVVASRDAMRNPDAMDWFADFSSDSRIVELTGRGGRPGHRS
ncbi:acetoacetyl-CoA synthetase [Sphingopyxis sp. Root1497]|nr:acetoacetyl-CoA synthetase [Sphingopyxis sp. Root1497]